MKKQIITLMLSAAMCLIRPVFAMDDPQDSNSFHECSKIADRGEVHKALITYRVRTMLNRHKVYELNVENNTDYKGLVTSIEDLFHKKPTTLMTSGIKCPSALITEENWHILRWLAYNDKNFTIWLFLGDN